MALANKLELGTNMDWTTERINTLTKLWGGGLSTREIGLRLSVTKNAVVGKVHRLGLSKRQSPIIERPCVPEVIPLDKLTAGMCSWPDGEPGTPSLRFCGKLSIPDKPYCAEHCARAYVRGSKGREANRAA
jgi:GcrA cell cycle regulator